MSETLFTLEQVAKHNVETDAWIIVDGVVYDITAFIDQHPGGVSVMEDYFGQDCSEVMRDASIHDHSDNAFSMLSGYKIGLVRSAAKTSSSSAASSGASDADADLSDEEPQEDSIEKLKQGQNDVVQRDPETGLFNRAGWGKVDFRAPIVNQVGKLGLDYLPWCDSEPLHFKEPVRMFGPNWMEACTKTKWWMIPAFWIPVLSGCALYAWKMPTSSTPQASGISSVVSGYIGKAVSKILDVALQASSKLNVPAKISTALQTPEAFRATQQIGLTTAGFAFWFLFEYNVHRHLFHWDWLGTRGYWITNVLHFLLHGMHHKVPMDRDRLVMPIVLALTLGTPTLGALTTIMPLQQSLPFMTGLGLGYVCYDLTHYALHHANAKGMPWPLRNIFETQHYARLRKHHHIHHFNPVGHLYNFGITNMGIDKVLGTFKGSH